MQPESNKFTTTLRKIKSFGPCEAGWDTLTTALGTTAPDTEVSLAFILNSNGIHDAIWALRCFDYKDYCLFTVAVAESVVHLNPDPRVSAAIAAVRAWHKGQISKEELRGAARAADAAADAAAARTARAADAAARAAVWTAYAAYAAARAAVWTAYAAYAAAAAAAADAVYAAADAVYAANAADAIYMENTQWEKTTKLFIKHFCQEQNEY